MALTNEDLLAIKELLKPIHNRLDSMDSRLDKMDDRFDSMDGRLDSMDSRLDSMDGRLDSMDSRLDVIEMKQGITAKKLDDLLLNVKIFERDIRRDIHILNDEMETVVEKLKQHELLPR